MTPEDHQFSPSRKLNFLIGICAMLISMASLYATYLQAESAEQQVKAMTYPLVQFASSNYDTNVKERAISLALVNNGVGPAIIKSTQYHYQDKVFRNIHEFMKACCQSEMDILKDSASQGLSAIDAQIVTSTDRGIIVPANESVQVLYLLFHSSNKNLWEKLNHERRSLSVSVCYCSLLDQCYRTEPGQRINEVDHCS